MKCNVIEPSIRERPDLDRAVTQASAWLEEVLGQSAQLVSAHWDLERDDKGKTWVKLTIKDPFGGPESASFDEKELLAPFQMRIRLHDLWGALLEDKSTRLWKRLHEQARDLGVTANATVEH